MLVMERCSGSLDQIYFPEGHYRKYEGAFPAHIDAMVQMAEAVEYLHSNEMIHCDIKPSSVLIWTNEQDAKEARLKLANFDSCQAPFRRGRFAASSSTGRSTLQWMAPELLELLDASSAAMGSADQVFGSFKGDIFALGCVFFFLLHGGRHPFGSSNSIEYNVVRGEAIVLQQVIASANGDWKLQLVKRMIDKHPHTRPQSSDVAAACHAFCTL